MISTLLQGINFSDRGKVIFYVKSPLYIYWYEREFA